MNFEIWSKASKNSSPNYVGIFKAEISKIHGFCSAKNSTKSGNFP